MESLTQKVLQYQRTREGLAEIVNELAPRVYQFPRHRMGWDEDACGEFYVFIHPRLLRLLDRFHDQGKPFESYLWAVLSWQLRNFARERRRAERAWTASLSINPGDAFTVEEPECSSVPELPGSTAFARCVRSDADRRNFLILVLKCSRLLDAENAAALAPVAGLAPDDLLALAAKLQTVRAARDLRLDTFRCRRNKSYAQALQLEVELRGEVDPSRIAALQTALERHRRRIRTAMHRMARVNVSPTNREIAALLGIPKGTVDSGLYWLKRKLASVYDPDHLRSA
jgi:DNA-directed RNA polymerase specialized sigma24 family protein